MMEILSELENFDFSKLKIAMIFGGFSSESDVSRMSASDISPVLKSLSPNYFEIDFKNDNAIEKLVAFSPDIVFNAMHGEFGEDGRLSAVLDYYKILYTHSGVLASSICMNKHITKSLVRDKIPLANSVLVQKSQVTEAEISKYFDQFGCEKLIIKPVDDGSSVGISIVEQGKNFDLSESLKSNKTHFLIEEFIDGIEISVPVLLGEALGALQLVPKSGFYNYENKYTDGKTDHIYPACLPEDIYSMVKNYAEIAHKITMCKTLSRSDFRVNLNTGRVYFMEINTHPGMTRLSIFPEVAQKCGINWANLIKIILYDAWKS